MFNNLLKRLRIKHIEISSQNHNGNGNHENRHRQINSGIIALLLQYTKSITSYAFALPGILFAIRNSVPVKRSFSPAELMIGHKLKFPGDLLNPSSGKMENLQLHDNIAKKLAYFKKIRTIALEEDFEARSLANSAKYATRSDKFAVGDLVWFCSEANRDGHQVTKKHQTNSIGPYIVLQCYPGRQNSYKLKHINGNGTKVIINRKFLHAVGDESEATEFTTNLDIAHKRSKAVLDAREDSKEAIGVESPNQTSPNKPRRKRTQVDPGFFIKT